MKKEKPEIKLSDESELQHYRTQLSKKEQELFNVQFRLDSALEDMQKHEQEISKLQNDEISFKKYKRRFDQPNGSFKKRKKSFRA